ncbi:uncharacterized protein si:dkey-29h14.10 isoform X2 [Hypomesus transpacificus]|uniref:uncharacterized protein si:dkey-29h14.10 isoform X2 n=1 Tax=Hypomesus transpacificus TaxID=137520 RepID=UPI001F074240|nr:uncharacterized protein si:dkey-29h14.10 isoform X2 [Hypomesus transpacificus]
MIHSNKEQAELSDKRLRLQSPALSRRLSASVVERVSRSLRSSGTITEMERQVIMSQPTVMQKSTKLMQIVISKGCNACELFYSSLDMCGSLIFEGPDPAHLSLENSPVPERDDPTPTYIINIQNSTLNHCIIGSGNHQDVLVEQQPLLGPVPGLAPGCNCSCGHQIVVQTTQPESQGVEVQSCSVQYVIIGDDNTMEVNHTQSPAEEDSDIPED